MPLKKKVKKNKKEILQDPWDFLPNFDDDINFPLVVEEEDSFGKKRRMILDHNMKLVPMPDEKENLIVTDRSDVLVKESSKRSNLPPNDEKEITDFKFSSPLIMQNKKKGFHQNLTIKNKVKDIEISKGILKNKECNVASKEEHENKRMSGKVMFSSPIIGYTPRGKTQLQENRKELLEKLHNFKETPILSMGLKTNTNVQNSLEYLSEDNNSSKQHDILKLSSSIVLKESYTEENKNSISDLFSNSSLLGSQDVTSSSAISQTSDNIFPVSSQLNLELKDSGMGKPIQTVKDIASSSSKSKDDEHIFPAHPNDIEMEKSLQVVNVEDRRKWLQLAKRRSRLIKRRQGLNESFWNIYHADDSLSVILKLCQVPSIQTFAKVFPSSVKKSICKLGEGSFGEVFMLKNSDDENMVVKFIPVESDIEYNGAPMTTFEDVLSEIVIAKELADLSLGRLNRCRSFVQMSSVNSVSVTRGRFPSYFQTEWDKANKVKRSENDNPKILGCHQHWIVLQFHFAGTPLEDFPVRNWKEAYSILTQVALSLSCAENHVEFEHRDLHLGNILVLRLEDESLQETFIIDGEPICVELNGVQTTIIDFTFSRINKNGNVVFVDLSKDKDLFLGTGDIQFDVYRDMQTCNKNDWCVFNPRSNILWLHFLGVKLIEKLNKDNVKEDLFRGRFDTFHGSVLSFSSVTLLIKNTF